VAVQPPAALAARPRLFAALERAFSVSFDAGGGAGTDGAILFGDEPGPERVPLLSFASPEPSEGRAANARMAARAPLDRRLRGISLSATLAEGPLMPGAGADVLAETAGGPVWAHEQVAGIAHDELAARLPELKPSQGLRDLFWRDGVALVALVGFLRELAEPLAYRPPPLRATVLFDDPNLRWRTYGFIDYRRLLAHADAHGYHASMAMIPLDGGPQHRATVGLFRRRPDRLSLAFHGNNHHAEELLRADEDGATEILAQALRRVGRFEGRTGLRVDRVMTPPHGMCSAGAAAALAPLGFDALCAIHPLPWTEQPPPERPLAGWSPAEFAADCAVIPRAPLWIDRAEIAMRAYLDQPLVFYGHHDDLAKGLDVLAELAATVNDLGEVRWASLGEIAASNWAARLDGKLLRVRPYTHRARVGLPETASSMVVERPRDLGAGFAAWSLAGEGTLAFDAHVPCPPGEHEIRLTPFVTIDPAAVPAPGPSVWPALRRAATETRDRLRPILTATQR
jgi:hypothetical protein